MIRRLVAALIVSLAVPEAEAQRTTPPGLVLDGDVGEWAGMSPAFPLIKKGDNARTGTVLVGETGEGVVIAGTVAGAAPKWPRSADQMAQSDHIEIWIADARLSELPPVGWGHQFGWEYLATEQSCDTRMSDTRVDTSAAARGTCKLWFRKQARHRSAVRKLLMRQWQVAPEVVAEVYATPAFLGLDSAARRPMRALDPAGPAPHGRFAAGATTGTAYSFEYLVPWEALPPVQSLRLGDLRVLVDVFSPGTGPLRYGPYSTIAAGRKYGDPSTFPLVRLPDVRDYRLGACRDEGTPVIHVGPNVDYINPSDSARRYYRPAASPDLGRIIVLDNEGAGYQYEVSPGSLSPVALVNEVWTRDLGQGETLCGPHVAWLRASGLTRSEFVIDSPDRVETRRLPNGDVVVKFGPRVYGSYYGSGQCGACPRVGLAIYYLNGSTGAVTEALSFTEIAEVESSELDIWVSPDWNTIRIYRSKTVYPEAPNKGEIKTSWTETTHCFRPALKTFEECGTKENVPAPNPRSLNLEVIYNR